MKHCFVCFLFKIIAPDARNQKISFVALLIIIMLIAAVCLN
ncbi:hypothetical protein HMPREF9548_00398 [Escherichia coli MS 182-1]|uniref:Uncharacterized protein n=1 Tax=Escherichia coli TaxID=562 RepID=A0A7U1E1B0_ECOLX|nr:hypothetical protein HMPREF9548_00398 [Escherichia coli MS 182-1]QQZ47004.1 hypothetical protein [Escherichia coli]